MIRRQREDRSGRSVGVWGDEGKAAREIRRKNKLGGGVRGRNERLDREKERTEVETTDSWWQEVSER